MNVRGKITMNDALLITSTLGTRSPKPKDAAPLFLSGVCG